MRKQSRQFYSKFFAGAMLPGAMLVCGSMAQAKDKTAAPASSPKDEIQVVGHIPLTGGPVTRFLSTQHYSSYYLYAEHGASASVTLIDVTKAAKPAVLTDVSYARGGASESLMVVAGTAALINSEPLLNSGPGAATPTPAPQTLKIMDFSDPQHPKVAREFTGVTAIGRSDQRGLIFVANSDGIWILQQHLAEDPEMLKAYDDYLRYNR
jgi:hypothetical protein